jgi:hypothetical protein
LVGEFDFNSYFVIVDGFRKLALVVNVAGIVRNGRGIGRGVHGENVGKRQSHIIKAAHDHFIRPMTASQAVMQYSRRRH